MHPHEHRLTRRNLMRGALGAGAAVGVAGVAAGCANTTTAVGSGAGGGQPGGAEVRRRRSRPGRDGLPLPRTDNSVTWAITDDNPPIKDGLKPEGGTLNVYNYADYIWPGLVKRFEKQFNCKVKIATYNSSDEAAAKLAAGAVDFDVVIGLSANQMVGFIAQQLMQPLTHSYLPNLAKNIWPALQDPFYDRGARYTVPYVVWMDGIGWRNDKIGKDIAGMKVPWDIFWESKPWTGKVGLLDDERDALSMPMQRDAMRTGTVARPQHRRRRDHREGRPRPRAAHEHLQHQGHDHRLPDAARGQDLAAPLVVGRPAQRGALLPAEGHEARRALVLGPRRERRRAERHALDPAQVEEAGARARVPQLHARQEERVRQLRAVQRLLAAAEHDRRRLAGQEGPDPEEPRAGGPAARPVREQPGAARAQRRRHHRWQNAWSKFKAG